MLNEQAKVAENETPKLLSADISDRIDALKREVNYLVSKIKYFRPKTTKKPPTVKKPANSTSSANKTETESDTQSKKPESETGSGDSEESGKNEKVNDQDIFDSTDQEDQQTSSPPPTEEDIYNEEEGEEEDPTTSASKLNTFFNLLFDAFLKSFIN